MPRFAYSRAVFMLVAVVPVWGHTEDFQVGWAPPSGRLQVNYDPALYPWLLPPSAEPALAGFALDDPGFVSLEPNDAIPGVFETLDPSALIRLQVVAVSSPEFKVWDPLGPGENGFQITGSRWWTLGQPFFDTHPWWQIDTADAHYDPGHSPWSVTFQLLDGAGIYAASDPITVTFTPEPATMALLVLTAGLAGIQPRLRHGLGTGGHGSRTAT